MKASINAYRMIKDFEILKLEAYRCPAGVLTIGYGHTKNVKAGDKITVQEADELLDDDVAECEHGIESLRLPNLTQNQYDALVSFVFNLGIGNLGMSTLRKKIALNPDDKTIKAEFMRWVHADGKVLPGLIRRRDKEAQLYFTE